MEELDYRGIFAQAPSLYLLLEAGAPYRILDASDAYLAATMTRRAEIVGKELFVVFPDNPADPAATGTANLRASLERALASKAPDLMAVQKYDIRRPDGEFEERHWSPINAPMLDADGRVSCIVHRVEDVTALVRMTRVKESMERELHRRRDELERANRDLEAFNYTVAHDLRAPLRAIAGFAGLLRADCRASLTPEGLRHLDLIIGGVERMRKLIQDLLDLGRVSRQELRRVEVDLAAIAREAASNLAREGPGASVRFAAPESLPASADPILLRDVMENLLANAWKFSSGVEEPRVEFGASREKGETVYFVRDNGAGFDMAYGHKLFTAFQRLHSHAEFPGSGIGLASVQRIVTRHGGRVWAEGEVGRGATFYFTLGA